MPNPKPLLNDHSSIVEFIRYAMMERFSDDLSMEQIAAFSYSLGSHVHAELDRLRVEMRLLREDRAAWRQKAWASQEEVSDAKP